MENASKALIIAGAILLAIVLVSLGVLVINNARSDIDDQGIDQAQVEAFNAKITAYCGKKKSGTDMNNLIDTISASNAAQTNKAEKHYINVEFWEGSTKKEYIGGQAVTYPIFENSSKYKTTAWYLGNGYIYNVKIEYDN